MRPRKRKPKMAGELELASLRDRFAAAVTDSLIEFAATLPLFFVVVVTGSEGGPSSTIVFVVGFLAIHYALPAYWASRDGDDSPGKRRRGIRVIDVDGGRISFGRGVLRVFILDLAGLLNGIWAFFDKRSQGLHDKAARTLVVRVAPAPKTERSDETIEAIRRGLPGVGCPVCGFALAADGSCGVCGRPSGRPLAA